MEINLTSPEQMKDRITGQLNTMFSDSEYGFEVYVQMKDSHEIKRFLPYSGKPADRTNPNKNFKLKMQQKIAEGLQNKFIGEDIEFDSVENIADKQEKFYVIPESESYHPFSVTNMTEQELEQLPAICSEELMNVKGILFCFRRAMQTPIWAFQFVYQNALPNVRKNAFSVIPHEDTFVELDKPILIISQKIDLLIVDHCMITDNIQMMQRNYEFETFIRFTANQVVLAVEQLNMVENMDKLTAYIQAKKLTHARKMMRIRYSKVLKLSPEQLYQRIKTVPRWSKEFEFNAETRRIILKTNAHVEKLIDLLDERFTRSDITGQEYDTSAKKLAPPLE